jgi:hypothetical protein
MSDTPTTSDAPAASRRLHGVLLADMTGFSRLMGEDESRAMAALMRIRDVFAAVVPRHGGTLDVFVGDCFVALFDSAVEAVRAAIAIQGELASNAGVAGDPVRIRMQLFFVTAGETQQQSRCEVQVVEVEKTVLAAQHHVADTDHVVALVELILDDEDLAVGKLTGHGERQIRAEVAVDDRHGDARLDVVPDSVGSREEELVHLRADVEPRQVECGEEALDRNRRSVVQIRGVVAVDLRQLNVLIDERDVEVPRTERIGALEIHLAVCRRLAAEVTGRRVERIRNTGGWSRQRQRARKRALDRSADQIDAVLELHQNVLGGDP